MNEIPGVTELELFKILGGSGGVFALFVWVLFKAYTSSNQKMMDVQEKRIEAVEERSKACEADRLELRNRMDDLQGEFLEDTRAALERSSQALEMITKLAGERGWSIVHNGQN